MANLVTKKKTKIVLISFLVLFFVSILSAIFFKLNLGVEFMDATVISMQLDHEDTMSNFEPKVSKYLPVSKVEKEGTSNFYFYFQNISKDDAKNLITNIKTDNVGVVSTGVMEYKAARERALIQRMEIISGFGIVAFSIYFLANLKNKKLTFGNVLSMWLSEMLVILVNLTLLVGFVSILGKLGVVMDTNFWSIFFLSLGIVMIFRIYEILKVRMVLRTLEIDSLSDVYSKMIKIYWPEFIFISCFVGLVSFLPLTVFGISILKTSIILIYAIIIALATVIYLKPFLLNEVSAILGSKFFKKTSFLSKKW